MRPRVYCDFHGLVDENTYALDTRGSFDDMKLLDGGPSVGLPVTFYMDDSDDAGRADDVLVDGTLDQLEPWGWVGRVNAETWRHQSDDSA